MEGANLQNLSTIILVGVTAYYAITTSKILQENRKDRKREEILDILSFGLYPIWNELLNHEYTWAQSKYNDNYSQIPIIGWPDIHSYLSFSDVPKETNQKNITKNISDYKDKQQEYKTKRKEVRVEIEEIIESDAYQEWVSIGVDTEADIQGNLENNSRTYADSILDNEPMVSNNIEEIFELIDDDLFDILNYESINLKIKRLNELSSELQENNGKLQKQLKLSSIQLRDKYNILNTTIHSNRDRHRNKKEQGFTSRISALSYLWRHLEDNYPP